MQMHDADPNPGPPLAVAIDRVRTRMWHIGYRMTGNRDDADDLAQEAVARAIDRAPGLAHAEGLEGWLLRITTTVAIDHLRRLRVERRVAELCDAPGGTELAPRAQERNPEEAAILRDDVRAATFVALRRLPPRQRAVLILRDVCDCPMEEVAAAIGTNGNAAKALLGRAREALARTPRPGDAGSSADAALVERLAEAISTRSIPAVTALLDGARRVPSSEDDA